MAIAGITDKKAEKLKDQLWSIYFQDGQTEPNKKTLETTIELVDELIFKGYLQ